jgi:hypothetical protein
VKRMAAMCSSLKDKVSPQDLSNAVRTFANTGEVKMDLKGMTAYVDLTLDSSDDEAPPSEPEPEPEIVIPPGLLKCPDVSEDEALDSDAIKEGLAALPYSEPEKTGSDSDGVAARARNNKRAFEDSDDRMERKFKAERADRRKRNAERAVRRESIVAKKVEEYKTKQKAARAREDSERQAAVALSLISNSQPRVVTSSDKPQKTVEYTPGGEADFDGDDESTTKKSTSHAGSAKRKRTDSAVDLIETDEEEDLVAQKELEGAAASTSPARNQNQIQETPATDSTDPTSDQAASQRPQRAAASKKRGSTTAPSTTAPNRAAKKRKTKKDEVSADGTLTSDQQKQARNEADRLRRKAKQEKKLDFGGVSESDRK